MSKIRRPLSGEEARTVIQLLDAGLSDIDIARRTRIPAGRIRYIARLLGHREKIYLTPSLRRVAELVETGLSDEEAARALGLKPITVILLRQRAGLYRRTPRSATPSFFYVVIRDLIDRLGFITSRDIKALFGKSRAKWYNEVMSMLSADGYRFLTLRRAIRVLPRKMVGTVVIWRPGAENLVADWLASLVEPRRGEMPSPRRVRAALASDGAPRSLLGALDEAYRRRLAGM